MKWTDSDKQGRLGVAIAETIISKLGEVFREQTSNDVGIDAHVELVDAQTRSATGQLVALQIKGGPSYFKNIAATGIIFRGEMDHLKYWLNHSLPVFLVIVDTEKQIAYWQDITSETVEQLEKGWKVEVPFANKLEQNFIDAVRRRIGLEPSSAVYTRLKLDDTSNALAKLYRASIFVRHPLTRLRLEAVIRRATTDIRKETFHRSPRLSHLANHEADVVGLFLAGDPEDAQNANWLCRSMWINPTLSAASRPLSIGGVDLGEGLEVVWNSDYDDNRTYLKSLEIDKQTYLDAVKSLITSTEILLEQAFGSGDTCIIDETEALKSAAAMRAVYLESNDIGLNPYECRDVAQRFQDVMALADNAFMQLDPEQKAETGSEHLIESALRDCRKNIERLCYEIEKVT